MEKIAILLSAVMLVCGLSVVAEAIPYSQTIIFTENNVLTETGTFSWTHIVPGDFSIPYDTVNSASLLITSRRAANENDTVSLVDFGELGFLNATGNSPVPTTFDLAGLGVFSANWDAGDPLDLTLSYNQATGTSNTLTMVSSVLTLDYENGFVPTVAPVPEPSTLILFSFGLGGVALARRLRKE